MKTYRYISPAIKVHAPSYKLLQIGVASGYNGGDIESKGNNAFEEDQQNNAWGRVWER